MARYPTSHELSEKQNDLKSNPLSSKRIRWRKRINHKTNNQLKSREAVTLLETFSAEEFVKTKIKEMKESIGDEKALVAVSGGVDSSTCAALTHRAIGENLVCIVLDDAFMREGEPEYVADVLSKPPADVPTKVFEVGERFMQAMKGLVDAEEKRKVFRETFYQALGEAAKKEGCKTLVQGTIRADIAETVAGIKTQHNVLEQMGINPMERFGFKVIEPLVTLFKEQVRMVARHLELPSELSERQPFPGPGLSVRVVGEIRPDKLSMLKKATVIAEHELARHRPSQYFAVIVDNKEAPQQNEPVHIQEIVARFLNVPSRNVRLRIFRDKATGMKGGSRRYGKILGIKVGGIKGDVHQMAIQNLVSLQAAITNQNPEVARVFYAVKDLPKEKPYIVGLRAVQTMDFLTAEVSDIPWATLAAAAEEIVEQCPDVSTVYYDVTPKPPSTIEME
jgi:GMP synthase (glutamine-hydrolysing)